MADRPAENSLNKNEKNRRHRILLILLFLLVAFSSYFLGYVLSKRSVPAGSGAIIDTIVLAPPNEDMDTNYESLPLSLSGFVCYSDGRYHTYGLVEMQSESKMTITDSKGRFLFHDVKPGRHTIFVLNDDEEVIAKVEVNIGTHNASGASLFQTGDGSYEFDIAIDVLLLEIEIEVDRDTGKIDIDLDYVTAVRQNGFIHMPDGTVLTSQEEILLTQGGAIVHPDGTIIFPSGRVILNNGTHIDPGGIVTLPDGSSMIIDDNIALPDTADPVSGTPKPDRATPSPLIGGEGEQNGTGGEPAGGEAILTPVPTATKLQEKTGATSEETSSEESPTDEPSDTKTKYLLTVVGGSGGGYYLPGTEVQIVAGSPAPGYAFRNWSGAINSLASASSANTTFYMPRDDATIVANYVEEELPFPTDQKPIVYEGHNSVATNSWTSLSTIDLFGAGSAKLYPGIHGEYHFRIQNPNDFEIGFDLNITEEAHAAGNIPFLYRLKKGGTYISGSSNWLTATQLAALQEKLGNLAYADYTLEWQWPADGNDALDTAIGSAGNRNHTLTMIIHIEQVTS